jgi:hypothetical protein
MSNISWSREAMEKSILELTHVTIAMNASLAIDRTAMKWFAISVVKPSQLTALEQIILKWKAAGLATFHLPSMKTV